MSGEETSCQQSSSSPSHKPLLRTSQSCDTVLYTHRRGILRRRTQSESLSSSFTMTHEENNIRKVSFDVIQIHEHPMILSDNCGGISGPPVSLDWEVQDCYELPLDKYEESRPERRNKNELALPDMMRVDILRKSGYSRLEITQLTRPVNVDRQRRMATIKGMKLAGIEELAERVSHKTLNILSFGRRKREERTFLQRSVLFDVGKVGERSSSRTDDTMDEDDLLHQVDLGDTAAAAAKENVKPLSQ